jgi:4-hydroxy-tetrahydrodipicolinate synthase
VKIPGVPAETDAATAHIRNLQRQLPDGFTIGVSGDAFAATGLIAGCDAWYSVIGGILPAHAMDITRAAQAGDFERARRRSDELTPLWELFAAHGSSRVVAVIAHLLGLTAPRTLPAPILGLDEAAHDAVRAALHGIGVDV